MKPDPVDTTNTLMLQMMNIMVNGPDAVNISNISSSTPYSSSAAWMQTLSYASLALSLLAAFGAVLGKQWLNSYKAARVPGSLEERGEKRQKKLDGMECWRLQTILKSFLVLLQISLFLFGFSLSADMWIQQKTISIVIYHVHHSFRNLLLLDYHLGVGVLSRQSLPVCGNSSICSDLQKILRTGAHSIRDTMIIHVIRRTNSPAIQRTAHHTLDYRFICQIICHPLASRNINKPGCCRACRRDGTCCTMGGGG